MCLNPLLVMTTVRLWMMRQSWCLMRKKLCHWITEEKRNRERIRNLWFPWLEGGVEARNLGALAFSSLPGWSRQFLLCSCTMELNKTKKQQHNFIPLPCAPFQRFIALMCQNEVKVWHILAKLSLETPCNSKKKHQTPSLKIYKKRSGWNQILG